MNLPNALTLMRIALIPIFAALALTDMDSARLAAALVFLLASLTDMLDGYLARKRSQVTDFGKLIDPMADKLLVTTALVVLLHLGDAHIVAVLVMLAREFVIMSVRLVAAGKGTVIAADALGKIKTVLQMVAVACLLLGRRAGVEEIHAAGEALLWASAAMSVVSCVSYLVRNKGVFIE